MWAWAGFHRSYICFWLRIQICCSHISPPQPVLRSATGESPTALFRCSHPPPKRHLGKVSLKKPSTEGNNPENKLTFAPRSLCFGAVLLAEDAGERGCWVDDGQRFSTVLPHPVIRVTACV